MTKWNDFVADFAEKKNIAYGCAIVRNDLRKAYAKKYDPVPRTRNIYRTLNDDGTVRQEGSRFGRKKASIRPPEKVAESKLKRVATYEKKAEEKYQREKVTAKEKRDKFEALQAEKKKQEAVAEAERKREKERKDREEYAKPENVEKRKRADAEERATKIGKDGLGNSILKGIINGTQNLKTKENQYDYKLEFLYPRELWLGKRKLENGNQYIYELTDEYSYLNNTGMEWDAEKKKLVVNTDYAYPAGQYYNQVTQYALDPKGTGLTKFTNNRGEVTYG